MTILFRGAKNQEATFKALQGTMLTVEGRSIEKQSV